MVKIKTIVYCDLYYIYVFRYTNIYHVIALNIVNRR